MKTRTAKLSGTAQKRHKGIRVRGGKVEIPRRITAKRSEGVASGRTFSKQATKRRK